MQNCICLFVFSCLFIFGACEPESSEGHTELAVLVPLQHPAMDAIVEALREELSNEPVRISVYNAQGDATLQSAILQQLKLQGCPLIMPIGTAATQMTLQRLPERQVVHLAAKFLEQDRQPGQRVCGVLDELAPELAVDLAQRLLPDLRKFTVVHSPADKVYPELAALEARAAQLGISVQRLLVQSQSELYSMGLHIAQDSQALLVLKDHMVVAGIATLAQAAQERGIPLIAADEGSVLGGADLASGVPEASIGRAGAQLVRSLLAGADAADLPIVQVDEVHLFYRPGCAARFALQDVAADLGYVAEELAL